MAGTVETPEFLDIQVQHLAGRVVLVALNRRGGFKAGEQVQSGPHQHPRNAAVSHFQRLADLAIRLALGARGDNAGLGRLGQRVRTVMLT